MWALKNGGASGALYAVHRLTPHTSDTLPHHQRVTAFVRELQVERCTINNDVDDNHDDVCAINFKVRKIVFFWPHAMLFYYDFIPNIVITLKGT
jgi:hypothetical protein